MTSGRRSSSRVRRGVVLTAVIVAVLGPVIAASAQQAEAPPFDVFSAATDAYALHLRGAVPLEAINAKPAHATGSADASPSSRGLAALIDPGFLVGAAIEGQGIELPGTANTGHPEGQTEDRASLAEPVTVGPLTVPAGQAESYSDDKGVSRQHARFAGLGSELVSAGTGAGRTFIGVQDGAYASSAAASLSDFVLGPVSIDNVRLNAAAVAPGPRGEARATTKLVIVGATVAGIPVSIDEHGIRVADSVLPAGSRQEQVDQALAAAGITVHPPGSRVLEDDTGERAEAEVWGPSLDMAPPGSPVRAGVSLGYAKATAAARLLGERAAEARDLPLLAPPGGLTVRDEIDALDLAADAATGRPPTPTSDRPGAFALGRIVESQPWVRPIYAGLGALLALTALSVPAGRMLERTMR